EPVPSAFAPRKHSFAEQPTTLLSFAERTTTKAFRLSRSLALRVAAFTRLGPVGGGWLPSVSEAPPNSVHHPLSSSARSALPGRAGGPSGCGFVSSDSSPASPVAPFM